MFYPTLNAIGFLVWLCTWPKPERRGEVRGDGMVDDGNSIIYCKTWYIPISSFGYNSATIPKICVLHLGVWVFVHCTAFMIVRRPAWRGILLYALQARKHWRRGALRRCPALWILLSGPLTFRKLPPYLYIVLRWPMRCRFAVRLRTCADYDFEDGSWMIGIGSQWVAWDIWWMPYAVFGVLFWSLWGVSQLCSRRGVGETAR